MFNHTVQSLVEVENKLDEYQFVDIAIDFSFVTQEEVQIIAKIHNLRSLAISRDKLSREKESENRALLISTIQRLDHLLDSLNFNEIISSGPVNELNQIGFLNCRALSFRKNYVTTTELIYLLKANPQLEFLDLSDNIRLMEFKKSMFELASALADLKRLHTLVMRNVFHYAHSFFLGDFIATLVSQSVSLTHLDFRDTDVICSVTYHISKILDQPNSRIVTFKIGSATKTINDEIRDSNFVISEKALSLDLSQNKFLLKPALSQKWHGQLYQLRRLVLIATDINDNTISGLLYLLKCAPYLEYLDVSRNRFHHQGLFNIASTLKNNEHLATLNVVDCLDPYKPQRPWYKRQCVDHSLATSLLMLRSLTHVDLSENPLFPEDLSRLSEHRGLVNIKVGDVAEHEQRLIPPPIKNSLIKNKTAQRNWQRVSILIAAYRTNHIFKNSIHPLIPDILEMAAPSAKI